LCYNGFVTKPKWTPIKIRLGQIEAWQDNPRMSTKAQAQRIIASERKFGQPVPFLLAPEQGGKFPLLDGHQRLSAWLTVYGSDYVMDGMVADRALSDEERREMVITLHTGATGSWNWEALSGWSAGDLQQWGMTGDTLKQWNNDATNLKELLNAENAEPVDAEPQIDRAAELQEKWQTASGQLWQLGEHRLLCGSSTERKNVERVFGDVRARLIWTDPPYGVKYGEKMESSNPIAHRVRTIENDDLPPAELEIFIRTALSYAAEFSRAGAAIYVASPAGTPLPSLIKAFDGSGFEYRWGLIWLKDQIVLSRADYHFKHENILYGWKPNGAHFFIDDRKQTSVFEYPRPKKSDEHPTMKPVELVQHMIKNSSEKGDVVYDCFGGSGTTLLACEREGRICRTIELSPNFAAVILERFYTATGITPELIG
jgi:DNA modification methylase